MRKLKLYLETSIFNVATSDQSPEYRDKTLELLDQVKAGKYEGYTSKVVIQEISRSDLKRAKELMAKIEESGLEILEDNAETDELAQKYIEADLIPVKYREDAVHIAVATYYELDVIMSWNFEHMVKLKTKRGVTPINVLAGYKPIEIISPLSTGGE